MAFIADKQELKPGLIIFRRTDVAHRRWYCRIQLPKTDRYKTISLKTADQGEARDNADLRQVREGRGELGAGVVFETKHGPAAFAVGDRVQFTDTIKRDGIFNGAVGTITAIERDRITAASIDRRPSGRACRGMRERSTGSGTAMRGRSTRARGARSTTPICIIRTIGVRRRPTSR
jgi:hypothetical protein